VRLVRLFIISVLVSFSSVAANDAIPMGRLPDSVEPRAYRLTLAIDPRQTEFSGATEIDLSLREPARAIWLHGHGLRVSDVVLVTSGRTVKGRYAEVETVSGVARVDFDEEIAAGRAVLRLTYAAPFEKAAQGLYRTDVAGQWYAFSQLEPIDARRLFPGFDEPRFKTPFDVTVVADRRDKVVSNTRLASKTSERNRVRHHFVVTHPLPTYLLAFAVGPLDIIHARAVPPSGLRRRPLPLRFVASKGQGKKLAFAARHTGEIVLWLEEYFGSAFPYPKLDLIASPIHGIAMENAGAIVFDDRHLLIGARPSPEQQSIFGGIVAHEIAHQWFGDLVTPVWWDDIWLNESFAQWLGSKISDRWRPGIGTRGDQLAATFKAMDTDALRVGRPMHQPIDDNRQIIGTFDEITYQKGAGVLAMFESYLGEARFRRGVRLHLRRHPHGSATADDFFAAMAEAAGEPPVLGAFRSFVDRPGVPFVSAVLSDDRSSLMLRQERYRPLGSAIAPDLLWDLPVCVRALSSADAPRQCVLMTGATASIDLRAPGGETGVMPNAGGEGYYRFAVDAASVRSALRDVANLTGAEALALADSIGASFAAGQLPFEEVLRGASALVSHQDRTAATRLGFLLAALHDQLRDAETRERLARRIDGIYAPALRAFGYAPKAGAYAGETADRRLRRDSLAEIVVVWGRDAEVTHTFASAAQATLANPRDPRPRLEGGGLGGGRAQRRCRPLQRATEAPRRERRRAGARGCRLRARTRGAGAGSVRRSSAPSPPTSRSEPGLQDPARTAREPGNASFHVEVGERKRGCAHRPLARLVPTRPAPHRRSVLRRSRTGCRRDRIRAAPRKGRAGRAAPGAPVGTDHPLHRADELDGERDQHGSRGRRDETGPLSSDDLGKDLPTAPTATARLSASAESRSLRAPPLP